MEVEQIRNNIKIINWLVLIADFALLLSCTNFSSFKIAEKQNQAHSMAKTTELKPKDEPVIRREEKPKYKSLGVFKLTAYCPCHICSEGWGAHTSSGAVATAGRTIGVNSNVIKENSIVVINGHEYIAEDTGGAMRENPYLIDIYMNTHQEALDFGVQYAEVFIEL